LDFYKIINTAMLDENKDQLDLKALLDKKGDLNQTGDLTILDTRDAEREGVSKMLANRLGAGLFHGSSGGCSFRCRRINHVNSGIHVWVSGQWARGGCWGHLAVAMVGQ
jgi:hypothetical protein